MGLDTFWNRLGFGFGRHFPQGILVTRTPISLHRNLRTTGMDGDDCLLSIDSSTFWLGNVLAARWGHLLLRGRGDLRRKEARSVSRPFRLS